jgi:hypothetical protein
MGVLGSQNLGLRTNVRPRTIEKFGSPMLPSGQVRPIGKNCGNVYIEHVTQDSAA